MPLSIKICGLSDEQSVRAVSKAGADYAGFVYFPASPRHVTLERAASLKLLLAPEVKTVCVLVDPTDALLERVQTVVKPDYVQLHGSETPARIQTIRRRFAGIRLIKAIKVATASDIAQAEPYYKLVDMLMFDAAPPKDAVLPGGNGVAFDWPLLAGYNGPLPWFLSGGLNAGNVPLAVRASGAQMIDVSSGVECAPGTKDPELIGFFVEAARTI